MEPNRSALMSGCHQLFHYHHFMNIQMKWAESGNQPSVVSPVNRLLQVITLLLHCYWVTGINLFHRFDFWPWLRFVIGIQLVGVWNLISRPSVHMESQFCMMYAFDICSLNLSQRPRAVITAPANPATTDMWHWPCLQMVRLISRAVSINSTFGEQFIFSNYGCLVF